MKGTSKQSFDLSPKRRALLEALLKREGVPTAPVERIPRRQDQGPAPLSFAQQRLWFLSQLEPGLPAYNLPSAVRFTGRLDTQALEKSLNEIVRRHHALRTAFVVIKDKPCQMIAPDLSLSLPVTDLSRLPEDKREEEVTQQAAAR